MKIRLTSVFLLVAMLGLLFAGAGDVMSGPRIRFGNASWYGTRFHGRRTASGEIYNMYALTAAHKELPFNTMVRVTNLLNDEVLVVRINDRGPYVKNRDLDLSYGAARRLRMLRTGVAPVRWVILPQDGREDELPDS